MLYTPHAVHGDELEEIATSLYAFNSPSTSQVQVLFSIRCGAGNLLRQHYAYSMTWLQFMFLLVFGCRLGDISMECLSIGFRHLELAQPVQSPSRLPSISEAVHARCPLRGKSSLFLALKLMWNVSKTYHRYIYFSTTVLVKGSHLPTGMFL